MKRLLTLSLAALLAAGLTACGAAEERGDLAAKPVLYLYPEEETEVTVTLDFDGTLTSTYPDYGDGWTVTAARRHPHRSGHGPGILLPVLGGDHGCGVRLLHRLLGKQKLAISRPVGKCTGRRVKVHLQDFGVHHDGTILDTDLDPDLARRGHDRQALLLKVFALGRLDHPHHRGVKNCTSTSTPPAAALMP